MGSSLAFAATAPTREANRESAIFQTKYDYKQTEATTIIFIPIILRRTFRSILPVLEKYSGRNTMAKALSRLGSRREPSAKTSGRGSQ